MSVAPTQPVRTPRLARLRLVAGHLARVALGLIFLMAGVLKAIDPAEFARQISEYGIIGRGLSQIGAPILIAFELTLAFALIAGVWPRGTALVACGLLAVFIAVEAYGLSQGRTEACGCRRTCQVCGSLFR